MIIMQVPVLSPTHCVWPSLPMSIMMISDFSPTLDLDILCASFMKCSIGVCWKMVYRCYSITMMEEWQSGISVSERYLQASPSQLAPLCPQMVQHFKTSRTQTDGCQVCFRKVSVGMTFSDCPQMVQHFKTSRTLTDGCQVCLRKISVDMTFPACPTLSSDGTAFQDKQNIDRWIAVRCQKDICRHELPSLPNSVSEG
jgi:hypothetical protein